MSKEAEEYIDKTWEKSKLPPPIKEQWGEIMQSYAEHYHKESLKSLVDDLKGVHPEYFLEKINEQINVLEHGI